MSQLDAIIIELDKAEPKWFLDWAAGSDLRDYANDGLYYGEHEARKRLKTRLAQRVFNRVICAARDAGFVTISDWIPWYGGLKMPVERGAAIDVRYRNGVEKTNLKAGKSVDTEDWTHGTHEEPDAECDYDIVAYRVL